MCVCMYTFSEASHKCVFSEDLDRASFAYLKLEQD